jgi:choline dehydrogenase
MLLKFDYIVVGAGSSGCVTAARLVRDFGAKVLLLEAGRSDDSPLIHMPAGFSRLLGRPSGHLVSYTSSPQASLGSRTVTIEQANVLGGGSSVNAMTYTRGTRADYDGWNESLGGDGGWGWDDLLPHFLRQEGNQRLGLPLHGTEGPLRVSDPHHPTTEASRAFLLTLQAMGLGYAHDINAGDERGATYIQSTTYRGRRCSAATAFITPLRADPRLTIVFRSRALRILFESKRAIGVEYAVAGEKATTKAFVTGEVILTAGALVSPKLLMLSGIGPAAMLRKHGIDVLADLPGVGRNLQDHNDARMPIRTKGNFGYSGEDRGLKGLINGLQYLLFRSGPVCSTGSEVTAFYNPLDPGSNPTIQFYCMGVIYPPAGHRGPPPVGVTLIANLIAPKSRGRVGLRSADPADPPLIEPNWLSEPEDVASLLGGVKFLLELAKTAPFSKLVSEIIAPAPAEQISDETLAGFCRAVTSTNWHPAGTCRMGSDADPDAVLDSRLSVRGVRGLRVFDCSMMPRIISANTNAPIMAIADRGVELMMEKKSAPLASYRS